MHDASFVWADISSTNPFASTGTNQFLIRAAGGVGINTNNPGTNALSVRGSARFSTNVMVDGNLQVTGQILGTLSTSNAVLNSVSASNAFTITTGGTVAWFAGPQTTNNSPYHAEPFSGRNVLSGHSSNSVAAGVTGATIAGGGGIWIGRQDGFNRVEANFGTVAGGFGNRAGEFSFVGGGSDNTASGELGATVGGGERNTASGFHATVGGGQRNTASGIEATVGGGGVNTASGSDATVGGGLENTASGVYATVGGGYLNTASGSYATVGGGERNTASGQRATVGGGRSNAATGAFATIPGGSNNVATNNAFAAGRRAKATNNGAFVWADSTDADFASTATNQFLIRAGGGVGINTNNPGNNALLVNGSVLVTGQLISGNGSTASGIEATVGGGVNNTASGKLAMVGGGFENTAAGFGATVSGGYQNTAGGPTASSATVGGGEFNNASGYSATIGGGYQNTASFYYATIGGGYQNTASGNTATIGGGYLNTAGGDTATIGGGYLNTNSGESATIAGGFLNNASGTMSTIAGGHANSVTSQWSAVGGGYSNQATGQSSFVGGGEQNRAFGARSTVTGGSNNLVMSNANGGTIGGGELNTVEGTNATVPGGSDNQASGTGSFAAGVNAKAIHNYSFVWGGTPSVDTVSTNAMSYTARAPGGFRLLTSTNDVAGLVLPANSSSWGSLSDSNAKTAVTSINHRETLRKVAALPVTAWNYKHDPKRRYIGPMAQDFHAAFGLGHDDKHISTLDTDGVALSAIKGLVEELREQANRLAELEAELQALREEVGGNLPPAE